MPKSKRSKVVHLSKVEKKGKELSIRLHSLVREAASSYAHIFVFGVSNMRNNYLKEVRSRFPDSRLFFGKTKVMAKALGTSAEDEHLPGLSGLGRYLEGNVGLFCTNREPGEITDFFESYVKMDYARAGHPSSLTFTVPEGVVCSRGGSIAAEEDVAVQHSLEPQLRQRGMPTRLVKGKVVLDTPHTICKEEDVLNANQTWLLKIFGIVTAEFRVNVKAYWSAATQQVTKVEAMGE